MFMKYCYSFVGIEIDCTCEEDEFAMELMQN